LRPTADSLWAIPAWHQSPHKELVDATGADHLLVLDPLPRQWFQTDGLHGARVDQDHLLVTGVQLRPLTGRRPELVDDR
jgi:hypothetical protein